MLAGGLPWSRWKLKSRRKDTNRERAWGKCGKELGQPTPSENAGRVPSQSVITELNTGQGYKREFTKVILFCLCSPSWMLWRGVLYKQAVTQKRNFIQPEVTKITRNIWRKITFAKFYCFAELQCRWRFKENNCKQIVNDLKIWNMAYTKKIKSLWLIDHIQRQQACKLKLVLRDIYSEVRTLTSLKV